MSKVITYQSGRGMVSVTPKQEQIMRKAGQWFRDDHGQEMVDVFHGLHAGSPTHTDEQVQAMIADSAGAGSPA